MSTPIYFRRWFKIGIVFLGIGLFSYLLSVYQTAAYEKEFPELAKDERELFLDKLDQPPGDSGTIDKQRAERKLEVKMLHRIYGTYRYVGWVFGIIGVFFMLISTKEPQTPTIEDLDDEPESNIDK